MEVLKMNKDEIRDTVEQILMENYTLNMFSSDHRKLVSTKIAVALTTENNSDGVEGSSSDEPIHNLGSYIEEELKKDELHKKGLLEVGREPEDTNKNTKKKVEKQVEKQVKKNVSKPKVKPTAPKVPVQNIEKHIVKSKAKKPFKLD